jgi:phosphoglycolate phosphatase-like HAD superfamily hydrolase
MGYKRFNPDTDFLSLDFDGVIADSIEECLVVGHNAYAKFTKSGAQIRSLEALDERQQKECKRLRSFVRSGEDYVFIQLAMHNGIRIADQNAYDAFVNRHSNHKAIFLDLFYQQRELFCSTEEDLWMELNPLYRGLKQFLRQYPSNERLFIITTKQIKYALKILTGNRIEFMEENCFHASGRLTKLEIIKHLMAKHKISAENFYFIDDQVDTLEKVKGAGVHCFLAEWGYTTEAQILRANNENIPALSLEEFLTYFSKRQPSSVLCLKGKNELSSNRR